MIYRRCSLERALYCEEAGPLEYLERKKETLKKGDLRLTEQELSWDEWSMLSAREQALVMNTNTSSRLRLSLFQLRSGTYLTGLIWKKD
jgi:hypothetical protein